MKNIAFENESVKKSEDKVIKSGTSPKKINKI